MTEKTLESDPRREGSTPGPRTSTENTITNIDTSAASLHQHPSSSVLKRANSPIPEALDSFPMSRYRLNGYETQTVARKTTNFRLTRSQRTGVVFKEGKREAMTCGMVSPVRTKMSVWNAWKAEGDVYDYAACAHPAMDQCGIMRKVQWTHPPSANANWKNETATRPGYPKHASIIYALSAWLPKRGKGRTPMYESVPESFAFKMIRRIVLFRC
jgi:hypothetical protein